MKITIPSKWIFMVTYFEKVWARLVCHERLVHLRESIDFQEENTFLFRMCSLLHVVSFIFELEIFDFQKIWNLRYKQMGQTEFLIISLRKSTTISDR